MSVLEDVRLAFRLFRRNGVATAIALLSIALSVGATAVVFTAIKAVLIDPLPYARAGELVQIRSEYPKMQEQSNDDWAFWNDTQELIRRTRTLQSVGVYRFAVFDLAGDAGTTPEALYGVDMTAGLFPTLGVSPMLGRNVLPEEDRPGHASEMILSYGLWVRRFNSDRGVVGRNVTVNGHNCLIVGVMPPGFDFPLRRAAVHTPAPYFEFWAAPFAVPVNKDAGLGAVARLRPGVSIEAARQDLASISNTLSHDFPETNRDKVLKLNPVRDRTAGAARNSLLLLMTAALLFMLIGCANVANLLLARGFARQREISVRLAIGAGRARIVRQLLTESCVLAVLGAVGAYVLTAAAWKILPAVAPVSIPRLAGARADSAIFGFTLTLAMINGMLFAIAPALRLAGVKEAIALGGLGSRGAAAGKRDGTRSVLVIVEVALSVMLVLAGGELLASFVKLVRTDPGFAADDVLSSVVLPAPERYPTPDQHASFYRRILDSVRALPGVELAGTVDALPFSGENHGAFVSNGAGRLDAEIDVVGGDYLQTMGVRLLDGRWFRGEDMSKSSDAAMVSDFTAARLWPGRSAIGRRICVSCTPERPNNWKRVIGVVSSVHHAALSEPTIANVYVSGGAMEAAVFLVVRTEKPMGDLEKAIRHAIAAIDPNQPVLISASLRALVADSVADRRFIMLLLAITGVLALLMSAAGIYGVISYTTSRRTQEIGIRLALGTTPRDVHGLLFRQGFAAVAVGLALGFSAAMWLTAALRNFVVGVDSGNAAYLGVAVALVTVTAAVACWVPARRVIKIDPMSALRQE
jgi:putative ABC transport system permease protein